jgi:hypothetical protein
MRLDMEWISVKDILPKTNQSVLAVRLDTVVNMYLHSNGKWKTDGYCIKAHDGFDDVTHWMPLPPAPEIEQ